MTRISKQQRREQARGRLRRKLLDFRLTGSKVNQIRPGRLLHDLDCHVLKIVDVVGQGASIASLRAIDRTDALQPTVLMTLSDVLQCHFAMDCPLGNSDVLFAAADFQRRGRRKSRVRLVS